MEPEDIRKNYNSNFTDEKYQHFLKSVNDELPTPVGLRLAELPLFLSDGFRDRLVNAGSHIIDFILRPDFKHLTAKAIPDKWRCANENTHPHIITIDFGLSKDTDGQIVPKLIGLQLIFLITGPSTLMDLIKLDISIYLKKSSLDLIVLMKLY
jgi:hypothetical protein